MPNGLYGGVRGRGLNAPSYSIPRTSTHTLWCVRVQKYDAIIKIAHIYCACEINENNTKMRVHNAQKEMLCVPIYYNVYGKTKNCILDIMQYRQKIC